MQSMNYVVATTRDPPTGAQCCESKMEPDSHGHADVCRLAAEEYHTPALQNPAVKPSTYSKTLSKSLVPEASKWAGSVNKAVEESKA